MLRGVDADRGEKSVILSLRYESARTYDDVAADERHVQGGNHIGRFGELLSLPRPFRAA